MKREAPLEKKNIRYVRGTERAFFLTRACDVHVNVIYAFRVRRGVSLILFLRCLGLTRVCPERSLRARRRLRRSSHLRDRAGTVGQQIAGEFRNLDSAFDRAELFELVVPPARAASRCS